MPFATQLRTKTKTQQLNIQQSKQASKHSESSKSTSQAPPNDLDSPEVAHVEPTAVYQPITLNFSYTTAPSYIAAENPDMIHFQQVLNKWIRSQTNSRLVAFLLVSRECNACFCQVIHLIVAGEHLLKEAVNCGDASVLYRLFPRYDSSDRTNSTSDDEIILPPPYSPDASPIFVDIKSLDQAFRSKLHAIAVSVDGGRAVKVPIDAFCATIILLQARCGFVAGLLMVHQNERTKESERQAIAPHLTMIGTLLSIVVNVEEQKRLARQSQIFLTMAQNVFSSLRMSFVQ
ncbi:unnamed protein product [Anisakis simplex]|uniref:ANK_REP_REGION domain-containing protein n=1 Tax=Anisakis simplex TaxID=6269 RepID=A0A0M3JYZ9_ANISI|nr:unnamed protein product [Anisakis simplex]